MITEDYVSFETAKLLKEKGFDEQLCHFYTEEGLPIMYKTEKGVVWANNSKSEHAIVQPTLQMTMKWLREVHKQPINVWYDGDIWTSELYRTIESTFCLIGHFQTYEEACEAAIRYCLEHLI